MLEIDDLRKSRKKAQVAFHEFALSTASCPNYLFCFFEGKDNPYYVSRIKRFTNDYYPINCGGKQAVLDVYSLITNKIEYVKYKVGFFIDRDFDDSVGEKTPPIFETPCYSIENLYVSKQVFKEILTNAFYLYETTNNLHKLILNLYVKRQEEFHKSVLLFNAWYACQVEQKLKNSSKLILF